MIKRVLKFKLLCGLEGYIPLDTATLTEIDSANQFIECIHRYKNGIRKFNDRNPSITWSPTVALKAGNLSLDEIIHDIINSRKYLILTNISEDQLIVKLKEFDQLFELDFSNETISFYKKDALLDTPNYVFNIRGTMHINTMFSNWREVFYEDILVKESIDELNDELNDELVSLKVTLHDSINLKMSDALDTPEYTLWNTLFLANDELNKIILENCVIHIGYSGEGDSGDIDYINVVTTEDDKSHHSKLVELIEKEKYSMIDRLIWDVIDSKECGFYLNDGGYGEINISLTKFSWKHYNYYTSTDQSVSTNVDLDSELKSDTIFLDKKDHIEELSSPFESKIISTTIHAFEPMLTDELEQDMPDFLKKSESDV